MELDVVVKRVETLRVACTTARAPGYGYENIRPVFDEHLLPLSEALLDQGLRFGPCVAWYEDAPDGQVVVRLGWEVGDQAVRPVDGIAVQELPGAEVASTLVRGPLRDVVIPTLEALVGWILASGYQLAAAPSRELYHVLHTDESLQVTELQMPITRS